MQKYSPLVLRYFHHTPHQGRLDTLEPNVVSASVGLDENQDVLALFLLIEQGCVIDAKFLAQGSVAIIAGGEWLCDYVVGKNCNDLESLTVGYILEQLALPRVKVHVASLLCNALTQCMDT